MQLLDTGERRLGIFLMISVLIHGALLLAFPQLKMLGTYGSPNGQTDGVIQVIRVDADNKSSQSAKVVARTQQPASRPAAQSRQEEKPKQETPKPAETKPAAKEEPAAKVVEKATPAATATPPQEARPSSPRPETKPTPTSTPEKPVGVTDSGLLTSQSGPEVAVSQKDKSTEQATDVKEKKEEAALKATREESAPTEEVRTDTESATTVGGTSASSATESGTTSQPEPASPPLPPLPKGNSIFPRVGVIYPKGAQNEDASGTWIANVLFPTGNKPPVIQSVTKATGNRSLDSFAEGLVLRGLQFPDSGVDYVAVVEITFTGSPDYEVKVNVTKINYAQ